MIRRNLARVRRWQVILAGIALTVVASVLSNIVIDQGLRELGILQQDSSRLESRIDGLWQQHQELERKSELVLLAFADSGDVSRHGSLLQQELQAYVQRLTTFRPPFVAQGEPIIAQLRLEQQWLREQIDERYLERLQFDEKTTALRHALDRQRRTALML